MKTKKKYKDFKNDMPILVKIIAYIATTGLALSCIIPLLLCLSISFTDEETLGLYGYKFIPLKFSVEAYRYIFENGAQIWRAYGVTIVVLVSGVILGLLIMSLFSYAITRPSFPWKNQFSFFSYFTMLFSGGMVSSYIINSTVYHLRDTIWILILSGCVSAYNIILMRTYMKNSIPNEILESAAVDGASETRRFFQFALPMSVPMLATIALFMAVGYWNNWNTGMLYIIKNMDLSPIQLVLKRIENNIEFLAQAEQNSSMAGGDIEKLRQTVPSESFRMALTIMVALPMVVSYPFFQRFFISGITVGAVKG